VNCGRSVVFTINKTDRYHLTEILLKVALNTITLSLLPKLTLTLFLIFLF